MKPYFPIIVALDTCVHLNNIQCSTASDLDLQSLSHKGDSMLLCRLKLKVLK